MNSALSKPARIMVLAIGVVAALGLAACGSNDDNSVSVPTTKATASGNDASSGSASDGSVAEITIPDISLPDGVSIPDGVAGLSGQCSAYYQLFASAFAGDTSGVADLDDAVENLQDQVPDDLEDDVGVVAIGITKLVELSKKYEGNPTGLYADPEALALFGDSSFTDSSQRVQTWLETECATAG